MFSNQNNILANTEIKGGGGGFLSKVTVAGRLNKKG